MSVFFSRLTLLLPCCCLALLFSLTDGHAEEGSKYGAWQSSDNRLESLIKDLDRIIDQGTNARAAHPGFLEDLNALIDLYRKPERVIFFADDFSDFNFTENPAWVVGEGTFSIDAHGGLYSAIAAGKPPVEEEAGAESESDRNLRILLGVLNELRKEEKQPPEAVQETSTSAMISSAAGIANSFNLEFSFRSTNEWGSTSIGVIIGSDPYSGYHLVYQASPAENRPMRLIKYRYGKPYIIDEVHENSPDLDDGAEHIIGLTRAPNGDMTVTVDNAEVMRTADLSHREDFTGVLIVNNGGNYSYDNIIFFTEQ